MADSPYKNTGSDVPVDGKRVCDSRLAGDRAPRDALQLEGVRARDGGNHILARRSFLW